MSHTYVVGSYLPPHHARALVTALRTASPASEVVVLRDRAAERVPAGAFGDAQVVTSAVSMAWGGPGLNRSRHALLADLAVGPGDWVTFLAENSWPVRPVPAYEAHLEGSGADSAFDLGDDPELAQRYLRRSVVLPLSARGPVRSLVWRVGPHLPVGVQAHREGVPVRLDLPRRRTPFGPDLWVRVGSDWYAVGGRAVQALLSPRGERLLAYYATTSMSSESWAHTVVLNTPGLVNAPGRHHHVAFNGAHARVVGLGDVDAAGASGAWWTRKVEDDAVREALTRRAPTLA